MAGLAIVVVGLLRSVMAASAFDSLVSIAAVNAALQQHFAGEDSLTREEFAARLPTARESRDIRTLISLLAVQKDLTACVPSTISSFFPSLDGVLVLTTFQGIYCIVHEPLPYSPTALFPRSFGYAIIRTKRSYRMNLHHSAAHFQSDGTVTEQAAALFETTASRTLVNAGMSRYAITSSDASDCQPSNTAADAAHNTNLAFHSMLLGVWDSTKAEADAVYVQWHGMAEESCPRSAAFVSLGANGKNEVYLQANVASEVARAITTVSNGSIVGNTPLNDSQCTLVASSNVFGRVVNGVPQGKECSTAATAFAGNFIHIEQKTNSRSAIGYWSEALHKVFSSPSRRIHDELKA